MNIHTLFFFIALSFVGNEAIANPKIKISPSGTLVPPSSQIVDSKKNIWTLVNSGPVLHNQISMNGVIDPVTQQVIEILYYKGHVYQENDANNWYMYKEASGKWKQIARDPRVSAAGMPSSLMGAFYRFAVGLPYGVISSSATLTEPSPYPSAPAVPGDLFGPTGYCDQVASNGVSISSGIPVDPTKLSDITNLNVKWIRGGPEPFWTDFTHTFGPGIYDFSSTDAAQCALARNGIDPVINIPAGPVQYNTDPNTFSPASIPTYQSAEDYAGYCTAVAQHEQIFGNVRRYSIPGNEVNTNPQMFPDPNEPNGVSVPMIASYMKACYQAIKAVDPTSFVYGLELNMDGGVNAPGFVASLTALGCGPGVCYDGISMHLGLRYPFPPAGTPCYPNPGGDYSLQCIDDVQTAAGASVRILIGETVYTVPGAVPDEATKAVATVGEFELYAQNPFIDGINYANVDECAMYLPPSPFQGGCLISTSGTILPAYTALQNLFAP